MLDGYEARFLSPLKIEMLPGIDPALAVRLRAAGIRRLGQIAKLTEPQLSLLAGRAGRALARQAAGIDASRIRRTALPPARIEEQPLAAPTADRGGHPRGHPRRSASGSGRELRSRGVFAGTLTLRVRFADGRVDSRTTRLSEPTALDDALDGRRDGPARAHLARGSARSAPSACRAPACSPAAPSPRFFRSTPANQTARLRV